MISIVFLLGLLSLMFDCAAGERADYWPVDGVEDW